MFLLGGLWSEGYAPAVLDPSLYDETRARALGFSNLVPTKQAYEIANSALIEALAKEPRPLETDAIRFLGPRSRKAGVLGFHASRGRSRRIPSMAPGNVMPRASIREDGKHAKFTGVFLVSEEEWIVPKGTLCRHLDISRYSAYPSEAEVLIAVDDAFMQNVQRRKQTIICSSYALTQDYAHPSRREFIRRTMDELYALLPDAPVVIALDELDLDRVQPALDPADAAKLRTKAESDFFESTCKILEVEGLRSALEMRHFRVALDRVVSKKEREAKGTEND